MFGNCVDFEKSFIGRNVVWKIAKESKDGDIWFPPEVVFTGTADEADRYYIRHKKEIDYANKKLNVGYTVFWCEEV